MNDAERAAIEGVVADYFDSWFDGDPERMARVLHPDLAKRRVADDGSELWEVPKDDLVEDVTTGPKTGWNRDYQIRIIDMTEDTASVVVHSDPFTEYLHLARFEPGWQIVNALYRWNRRQPDS
jgi:Putative lumazine-binding